MPSPCGMRITQQSFWLDGDETLYWHVTCPRCQWRLNLSSWRFALSMAWLQIECHRSLGHCTVSA